MASPSPHHCHQSSLEGVISPPTPAIEPSHRIRATEIFNQIIDYYVPSQTKTGRYKQITLLGLTYEYVLSELSRDNSPCLIMPLSHRDYTVACICPMGLELAPVKAMLDQPHPGLRSAAGNSRKGVRWEVAA